LIVDQLAQGGQLLHALDCIATMTIMTCMTYSKGNTSNVTWTVAEAKAKFSEMMDCARTGGPQTITKNGRAAVVIVSAEEWNGRPSGEAAWWSFWLRRHCTPSI
jgi:prevent-host-death family protein